MATDATRKKLPILYGTTIPDEVEAVFIRPDHLQGSMM
jgi:hypothetical protein